MFGNLKDFLSVVQDGLSSNSNIRHTVQEVQKIKNIFREKQKVHSEFSESKVNYGAGGELLAKYQDDWAELHANADRNAKAADEADRLILELNEMTRKRLQSANELVQGLSHLPQLTASVAQCMDSLRNLHVLMRTVEDELVEFEEIVEREKMEKWKLDHHFQLSMYKDKKMADLEEIRCKLAKENAEKNLEREKKLLAELQAKRETSAVAFQVDVAKYLMGKLPAGPPSSPKITLEEVQLEDDKTDLEKFLES